MFNKAKNIDKFDTGTKWSGHVHAHTGGGVFSSTKFVFEPRRAKTNNVVSEQV